ncbi:hypothetical protein N431DRAFT_543936 [Stipitochalara longipes BDJ]|nr:hypothetical protein N431DRAFT_543936 [Stipitochalara longipes BDJ]
MPSPKTVAFFGATGGSTAPCLAKCLEAGYTCIALVRNAEKLTTLLKNSHFVNPDLMSKKLTIITGNAKDAIPVTQTLFPAILNPSNSKGNRSVDLIVSGIGCYPVMKKGNWFPEQEDPTLCQDVTTIILNALRARPPIVKPGLVILSGTGISKYGRDIPRLMVPLYHLLHTAHQDKKIQEDLAIAAVKEEPAPIGSYVLVRPSLLTNGAELGMQKVRWDVEDGGIARKAIGYSISRADVAGFVFEKVVRPFESGKGEGSGKIYSVTY